MQATCASLKRGFQTHGPSNIPQARKGGLPACLPGKRFVWLTLAKGALPTREHARLRQRQGRWSMQTPMSSNMEASNWTQLFLPGS